MLVYGPGGYKFTDFMRVGIPLNLSVGCAGLGADPLDLAAYAEKDFSPKASGARGTAARTKDLARHGPQSDQSGQKIRIAGIETATTRISSGRPMRQ